VSSLPNTSVNRFRATALHFTFRLGKTIALKLAFEVAVSLLRCDAAVCAKQKMEKEVNAV